MLTITRWLNYTYGSRRCFLIFCIHSPIYFFEIPKWSTWREMKGRIEPLSEFYQINTWFDNLSIIKLHKCRPTIPTCLSTFTTYCKFHSRHMPLHFDYFLQSFNNSYLSAHSTHFKLFFWILSVGCGWLYQVVTTSSSLLIRNLVVFRDDNNKRLIARVYTWILYIRVQWNCVSYSEK